MPSDNPKLCKDCAPFNPKYEYCHKWGQTVGINCHNCGVYIK